MPTRTINASDAPQPLGDYVQGVEITGPARLLVLSGQVGVDANHATPAGFDDQARLAWRNVLAQLAAAGMGIRDIVKTTFYLSDRAHLAANSRIRAEFMGDHRCASTAVIVQLLNPAWHLEIEVIASQDA